MFIGTCIILIVEYRETNLMSLALLFHYLMLNMFRMLIHPSSGTCDLFVELFHGLYRVTQKTGTFEKTQQKLKKSNKKIYWQKLNHYYCLLRSDP